MSAPETTHGRHGRPERIEVRFEREVEVRFDFRADPGDDSRPDLDNAMPPFDPEAGS